MNRGEKFLDGTPREVFAHYQELEEVGLAAPVSYTHLLVIEGAGSQILFAGYRFFLAGIFTFLIGSFLEKRWLMIRRSSVLPVFGQGTVSYTHLKTI